MEDIKNLLSKNLLTLRKSRNLTQLELAQKLNYSDKSISKWEHGDAVPDIEVLKRIADFYDVTVDYLISDNSKKPEVHSITKTNNRNKIIITGLSTMLVWLVATIVYSQLNIWLNIHYWPVFVWSVPASFIVLIVFNSIWGKRKFSFTITSCLVWSILASLYLQFLKFNLWIIFIIGIPLQIAIILWSQLKNQNKD
jgi:transcriptional regulator with XRE-family HTH domain